MRWIPLVAAALLPPAANADAASELTAMVAKCRSAHAGRALSEVIYSDFMKAWVKRIHEPALIGYDLRVDAPKATTAFIDVTDTTRSGRADSEAAAQAIPDSELQPLRITRRFNFVWQGGRWELLDGRTTVGALSNPASTTLSRAAILQFKDPLASCF